MDAITNELKDEPIVDAIAEKVEDLAKAMPPKAKSFLGGKWVEHPLHPMLTDLPVGFWTSSFLLDFLGGRRSRRISAAFVGLGVAVAAPTVASGVVEFEKLGTDDEKRDVAVVHTVANTIGTFIYLWSFLARLRGKRGKGIFLSLLGAAATVAGGYMGGRIAHAKEASPAPEPSRDQMRLAV